MVLLSSWLTMKERLKLFGWIGLYWIVFFVVSRIVFLFYHLSQTSSLHFTDIITLNALGLRMDLAMALLDGGNRWRISGRAANAIFFEGGNERCF